MKTRSGVYIKQLSGDVAFEAFFPKPLPPDPPVKYDEMLLSNADREIGELNGIAKYLPDVEYFIAMYVKKEASLSSQIEGTQVSLEGILEFEANMKPKTNVNNIDVVVNYIAAMNHGLDRLCELPMSLRLIREIHEILLKGTRGSEKTPGEFRTSQNFIGIQGATINDSEFVPPPPVDMKKSIGDLELFIHANDQIPPLVKIAMIHAQFETIHPFLDGNGRLGRLLITFFLCWKKILSKPLLYLSYYLKKYKSKSNDLLMRVRNEGDWESWVNFFLTGVIETSKEAKETANKIIRLKQRCIDMIFTNKIQSSYANKLLDELFHTPHIDSRSVSESMKISLKASSDLIKKLEDIGILKEVTGRKRSKKYVFKEYVDIIVKGTEIDI